MKKIVQRIGFFCLWISIAAPLIALILKSISAENITQNSRLVSSSINTIVLSLTTTISSLFIGASTALITARTNTPGNKWWHTLLALPLTIPSYIFAFTLIAVAGTQIYGFVGAWITITLITFPYVYIQTYSQLLHSNQHLEDIALCLGKKWWDIFKHVIIPAIKPALISSGLLVALYTISDFGAVSLLNYNTLTRTLFIDFFSSLDRSTIIMPILTLTVLALIPLIISLKYRKKIDHKKSKPHKQWQLGSYKWLTASYCFSIVTMSFIIPICILIYWVVSGIMKSTFTTSFAIFANSISIAVLTTIIAIALSLIIALSKKTFLTTLIEKTALLNFGIPSMILALAFVFLSLNYLPNIYQTIPLLIAAFTIKFISKSITSMNNSLKTINPSILESAVLLKKKKLSIVKKIIIPLIKPGILSGALLVFLGSIKELPLTIILSPIGFETLAVHAWSSAEEAFFADAALASLIIITISLSIWIYLNSHQKNEHNPEG